MSSERLCKLGEALSTLTDQMQADVENAVSEQSVREAADTLASWAVVVGRETIRLHRSRLCACYTLADMARPGAEAVTLSTAPVPIPEGQTPASVLEGVSVDSVPSDAVLVGTSRWQNARGEWLESHKYEYRKSAQASQSAYDDLAAIVERAKSVQAEERGHSGAFVVPAGDLQLGKPDGGGTAATVARFCEKTVKAADRMQALGGFDTVVLPWLGDCIEGSVSQGGRLALDIGVSEQLRLYRRLIMFQLETFARHANRVIVPVIPGNHDETRRDVATHSTDSWAIEGAAAVSDALALNPAAYGHVEFLFPPRGELTLALDVAGTRLGFAHGHQCGKDVPKWWAGQNFGRQAVGSADLLLTAHYHHLKLQSCGNDRTWIQTPALDGGSTWFRETNGEDVSAGMLSFVVENGGWADLTLH